MLPEAAEKAVLDSVEVSHPINDNEFFGNIGGIPDGIKWMVFKVKQKAEKSYYNLTEETTDDTKFKFDFDIGTKQPEYGYNYPYDYFTMLEMIQVESIKDNTPNVVDLKRKIPSREDEE